MNNQPIGVYDSGMGGISLLINIKRLLPRESVIYLGDGKNCPYGEKSRHEIVGFAEAAVRKLLEAGCKMIVVACNTATSAAIKSLREHYPTIPFVGMEPAIKPACKNTKSGVIAVLATKRSIESEILEQNIAKYASGVEVIKQVGEGLVEIVEQGAEQSDEAYERVKSIVDAILTKPVDQIVLGCTHYPFLTDQFKKAINGREIEVIEPSPAIVKRIKQLLSEGDIEADEKSVANYKFMTFADEEYRKKLIKKAEIYGNK